jgi:integrase/recombinase XerD
MFDQLFQLPRALTRHCNGPLADERKRYLAHLADQGVSLTRLRITARDLLYVATYLRLSERPKDILTHVEIEKHAVRFMRRRVRGARRKGSEKSRKRFIREATRWLQFLGRLQPPPTPRRPFSEQIAAFAENRREELGLVPVTISRECWWLHDFLGRLSNVRSLRGITITQLDQTLIDRVTQAGYARRTVLSLVCTLRTFFRYAEGHGWCRPGLAAAIQGPRIFAHETLPVGPSWADVQRLLATTESDRPADIRDRAILMLLAVYALRAKEVRCLRLEDIEWERELLTVTRCKTRSVQCFPLSRAVGEAILRYLKEVRPRSPHREIFLTLLHPYRPLRRQSLWPIVGPRLKSLGLSLSHHGPHTLRHACATRLLAEGLSLKEIGDFLGHRHPDSTRIYTKVDLTRLREVANFDLGGLV